MSCRVVKRPKSNRSYFFYIKIIHGISWYVKLMSYKTKECAIRLSLSLCKVNLKQNWLLKIHECWQCHTLVNCMWFAIKASCRQIGIFPPLQWKRLFVGLPLCNIVMQCWCFDWQFAPSKLWAQISTCCLMVFVCHCVSKKRWFRYCDGPW